MRYFVIIMMVFCVGTATSAERIITVHEKEVVTLPNGHKIRLTDDDDGGGVELYVGGALRTVKQGNYVNVGEYKVYCHRYDLKGDTAELRIVGPPLPRQSSAVTPTPPKPRVPCVKPVPQKTYVKPVPQKPKVPYVKPVPQKSISTPAPSVPCVKQTNPYQTDVKPNPKPDLPTLNLSDWCCLGDTALAHFQKQGSETNPANELVSKYDLPGSPGFGFSIMLIGPGWQDIDISITNPSLLSWFKGRSEKHYVMYVYNPNSTWISATIHITDSGYRDTGWQSIAPRTSKLFQMSLDGVILDNVKKIGLRVAATMGTKPKETPPGRIIDVHILPYPPLPSGLASAEAELLKGGVSDNGYRMHFRNEPRDYAHRFYIVKGLYAWRVSLGKPGAKEWRNLARDAFRQAREISKEEPFDICPKEWTAGTEVAWILLEKSDEKD